MSVSKRYEKHPNATRSYPVVLQNLGALSVSNPTATATPSGLVIATPVFNALTQQITCNIGGGTNATLYTVQYGFDLSNGEHPIVVFEIYVVT